MATPYKIAIVGPESSGKSSLALKLSSHYNTAFVPEISRNYLEKTDGKYEIDDLLSMAQLQLKEESKHLPNAQLFLFCDTNLLNFLIWSEVKYQKINPELKKLWKAEEYSFTLLCYPDLPYSQDSLREHPLEKDRLQLFQKHEKILESSYSSYVIIKGLGEERLKNAIEAVDSHFTL